MPNSQQERLLESRNRIQFRPIWRSEIEFQTVLNSSEAPNTPEFNNANYNLAYSYFKLKEYENAIQYFDAYTKSSKDDRVRLTDAYLRLGDCNFMAAKYWPAMDAYNKAIDMKSVDADYAKISKRN